MRRRRLALLCCLWSLGACASPPASPPLMEGAVDLEALSPTSAEVQQLFVEARGHQRARRGGAALPLLERALALDPRQPNVALHLCDAYLQEGLVIEARWACELALWLRGDSVDHSQLGVAWLMMDRQERAWGEPQRALRHAHAAILRAPHHIRGYDLLCRIALTRGDRGLLEATIAEMERRFPAHSKTHIHRAHLALLRRDPGAAQAALDEARRLGLSEGGGQHLQAQIDVMRPLWWRGGALLLELAWGLARFWIGLLLLVWLGRRALQRPSPQAAARALSQGSLWLLALAWPVTLMVLALVVGVGAALLAALLTGEVLSGELLLGVGAVSAAASALWLWRLESDRLPPQGRVSSDPALEAQVAAASARAGVRAPRAVWLVPGERVSLLREGDTLSLLQDLGQRVLVLGEGALGSSSLEGRLEEALARQARVARSAGGPLALELMARWERLGAARPGWVGVRAFARLYGWAAREAVSLHLTGPAPGADR